MFYECKSSLCYCEMPDRKMGTRR